MTSLYNLCKSGSVEEVRAAIDRGEDVNKRGGSFNATCLMVAVHRGHEEMVELLLQRDELDVNARDSGLQQGKTALHYACCQNNPRIVTKLLAHTGLDCNLKDQIGWTPLMLDMSYIMCAEIVRLLVEDERVDLDILDNEGRTIEERARLRFNGEKLENILHALSHGRLMREVVSLRREVVGLRRKEAFVSQIAKLQGTHTSSDMTVECQDEKFPCHRAILEARSPTFAGALNSGMIEATNGKYIVKYADPIAVKDMITFIYSSDIPEEGIKERAGELLDLARLYELPELAVACRMAMLKGLTTENAVGTLIQLDQADPDVSAKKAAKDEVIEFIKKHAKEIVKDEQWKTFFSNYPDLVTDILMMALDNK